MKNMPKEKNHILLITSREDLAADLLIVQLKKHGANYIRLNCEDFPTSVCISWEPNLDRRVLSYNGHDISYNTVISSWYRRSPLPILNDNLRPKAVRNFVCNESKAFLDGFWETGETFWINKPSKVFTAENKIVQLELAKKLGFKIPKTVISNNPRTVNEFAQEHNFVIAKPISVGSLEINRKKWGIYSSALMKKDLLNEKAIRISPFILQEPITRKSELRVTVVGKKIYATQIQINGIENMNADWHLVDQRFIKYSRHKIPEKIANLCLKATKYLGLVYSAFDFIITADGTYIFLEINPSGQWAWIEHKTNFPISKTLVELLIKGRV